MTTPQPEGPLTAHRITEPDLFPEPYPWCLACGFQHEANEHCPECTGDHSQSFCMTPELADELARVDARLRRRVEQAAAGLYAQVVTILCAEAGK
jgi:hypothetical protein